MSAHSGWRKEKYLSSTDSGYGSSGSSGIQTQSDMSKSQAVYATYIKHHGREEVGRNFLQIESRMRKDNRIEDIGIDSWADAVFRLQDGESVDSICEELSHSAGAKAAAKYDTIQTDSNNPSVSHQELEKPKEKPYRKSNSVNQETLCKICMEQKVGVVLFPCSHMVTCASCTTAIFACPVCRENIKGTVNAMF